MRPFSLRSRLVVFLTGGAVIVGAFLPSLFGDVPWLAQTGGPCTPGTGGRTDFLVWRFDTGSLAASVGAERGSLVMTGGVQDVNHNGELATAFYPPQGAGNDTGGIELTINTTGYADIIITWLQDFSPPSSKRRHALVSLNGSTVHEDYLTAPGPGPMDSTVILVPNAGNTTGLKLRITSVFADGTSAYAPALPIATYDPPAPWIFRSIRVSGVLCDEPASSAASSSAPASSSVASSSAPPSSSVQSSSVQSSDGGGGGDEGGGGEEAPPAPICGEAGEGCMVDHQCCGQLQCVNGICKAETPVCPVSKSYGASCAEDTDCCSGLYCDNYQAVDGKSEYHMTVNKGICDHAKSCFERVGIPACVKKPVENYYCVMKAGSHTCTRDVFCAYYNNLEKRTVRWQEEDFATIEEKREHCVVWNAENSRCWTYGIRGQSERDRRPTESDLSNTGVSPYLTGCEKGAGHCELQDCEEYLQITDGPANGLWECKRWRFACAKRDTKGDLIEGNYREPPYLGAYWIYHQGAYETIDNVDQSTGKVQRSYTASDGKTYPYPVGKSGYIQPGTLADGYENKTDCTAICGQTSGFPIVAGGDDTMDFGLPAGLRTGFIPLVGGGPYFPWYYGYAPSGWSTGRPNPISGGAGGTPLAPGAPDPGPSAGQPASGSPGSGAPPQSGAPSAGQPPSGGTPIAGDPGIPNPGTPGTPGIPGAPGTSAPGVSGGTPPSTDDPDLDSDGDGTPDIRDADPRDPTVSPDRNRDGIPDDGTGIAAPRGGSSSDAAASASARSASDRAASDRAVSDQAASAAVVALLPQEYSAGSSVGATPVCGNGFREIGEQCDDGNRDNDDGCTNGCRLPACGDGVLSAGEECDEGVYNGEFPDACRTDCRLPVCGDRIVDVAETCDDGTGRGDDGCTNACLLSDGESCVRDDQCDSALCEQGLCVAKNICGNGVREGREWCDDGNDDDADRCTSACLWSEGEPCGGNEECGSGLCASGACAAPRICGNGVPESGEECDEGAKNSNVIANRCRLNCRLAHVGDGVVDSGEQCDDGNGADGDGCTAEGRSERVAGNRSLDSAIAGLLDGGATPGAVLPGAQILPATLISPPFAGPLIGGVFDAGHAGAPLSNPETGPAALVFMVSGASAGYAWIRKRRR